MWIIHKQRLEITDRQAILMPKGAEILSVANQLESVCIWYKCDPDAEKVSRRFAVVGTGHLIDDRYHYKFIGTVLTHGGMLVWHVFELEH